MITVLFIILIMAVLAFLFYVFFGKQSKEEPKDTIIWKKPRLDDHEKALGD
jgi:hypothetical protein